jgi:ankyrin repeat protein
MRKSFLVLLLGVSVFSRAQQRTMASQYGGFEEPRLRPPAPHVPPPALHPDSKIAIILRRGHCYGSCPVYAVTLTNSTVEFDGRLFVAMTGRHTRRIDPAAVQDLARKFVESDFYSLYSDYWAHAFDLPAYELSIDIDGQKKTVQDYGGTAVGMPSFVNALEKEVDDVAQTTRWIQGGDQVIADLREENYNFASFDAQTMLKTAASRGNSAMVTQLLEAGVPLDVVLQPLPGNSGMTKVSNSAQWLTAAATHPDTLTVLMKAGASQHEQNDKDVALFIAARTGNLESARQLLAYGANPNADPRGLMLTQFNDGMALRFPAAGNILFYAALSGNPELVKTILSYHPDVNARGVNGHTPIFAAGFVGNDNVPGARATIVSLLVKAGADVNLHDDDGNTPLHDTYQPEVMEQLLALGADVNARNKAGETPIFHAPNAETMSVLVKHGADLTLRDNQGQTVFEADDKKGRGVQEALRQVAGQAPGR